MENIERELEQVRLQLADYERVEREKRVPDRS